MSNAHDRKYRQELLKNNPYCTYCKIKVNETTATLDHVVAVSLGGKNDIKNLVLSCNKCNGVKSDMTESRWAKILPILLKDNYSHLSRRQRRHWREENPNVLVYKVR